MEQFLDRLTHKLIHNTTGDGIAGPTSSVVLGYSENVGGLLTLPGAGGGDDIPGLFVTVTVPAGRRIRISSVTHLRSTVGTDTTYTRLVEDGVIKNFSYGNEGTTTSMFQQVLTPTAGTHTYNMRGVRASGSGSLQIYGAPGEPAWILVEDITGMTLPYSPASVPVGHLGYIQRVTDTAAISDLGVVPTLSLNITVPAGRVLKVTGHGQVHTTAAAGWIAYARMDGVIIGRLGVFMTDAAEYNLVDGSAIISPSAGAHVFDIQMDLFTGSGTTDWNAGLDYPMWLMVEDITPTPAPASGAPSGTLAYAQQTGASSAFSAETDVPGASVTVTVPAGRRLKIIGNLALASPTVANDEWVLWIAEDGVHKQLDVKRNPNIGDAMFLEAVYVSSPSAGMHTYKLTAQRSVGTGTAIMSGGSDRLGFILVEDISGSSIGLHTHTELDDTGWINLTFVNGWVVYDNNYGPNGYNGLSVAPVLRKKAGIVYLRGLVRGGTVGVNMATLPVGFRPGLGSTLFTTTKNGVLGRIDVQGDGQIIGAIVDNVWTSLNGIIFPADQ